MRKLYLTARLFILAIATLSINTAISQSTFPVNGVSEPSQKTYAFINAIIVKDAGSVLTNATMVIRDKKIVSVGTNVTVPSDAVTVDCRGKYIYPSFIDMYSDYGIPAQQTQQRGQGG